MDLAETTFSQDLEEKVLADSSCWSNLRGSEYLKHAVQIPLPQSNSQAAKQMRIAAVIAVLSRSLHRHVFRPLYIFAEDADLTDVLRELECANPAQEMHARSTLLDQDLAFTGGLVQVVDTLLVPPSRLEPTCRDAYSDLKAFLGALYTAGLVETFAETPNVTIFAPRNAAFQLLAGTLSGLARDDLARVLSYHVIPGRLVGSPDLSNGTRLTTLAKDAAGSSLDVLITQTGNNRYVDSAQLVQPDILVANGVVHMIDNVLNPDAAAARPNPSLGTQAPVFPVSGASSTGSRVAVPFTTALPCTSDCPITTTASANSTSEATSTTSSRTTTTAGSASSRGAGGMLTPPRCTGLAGAGMVGMGMLAMAAVV